MDYKQRISRNQRPRGRLPWIGIIAILVILCLAAITIYRLKFRKSPEQTRSYAIKQYPPQNFQATADALVIRCCQSFGLSDSVHIESTTGQGSAIPYHQFRQGWPSELPFLLFAQRLNDDAQRSSFQCDCEESSKLGNLDCFIKVGNNVGARVVLDANRKTNLADREVAIVLDDLGQFSGEDIISLIRSGVIFSYIGRPDYYPGGEMVKLFARNNITSILRLPKGKNREENLPAYKEPIVKNAMTLHPGAKSFIFDNYGISDSGFIKAIVKDAIRGKLPYLHNSDDVRPIDRFVLSLGIQVVNLEFKTDAERQLDSLYSNNSRDSRGANDMSARYNIDLFNRLLAAEGPRHFAVCFSAHNIRPEGLISLKGTLSALGVKLRPYMRLAEKAENL